MLDLRSRLTDFFKPDSAVTLEQGLGIVTLAGLLAQWPYDYYEPTSGSTIDSLQKGILVVVRGVIASRQEQLIELPGGRGRIQVPYITVSDETGTLTVRWMKKRNDVPPGMFPGENVAVEGQPSPMPAGGGPGVQIHWYMDDPVVSSVRDWRVPAPFFDAPGPRYLHDEENDGQLQRSAIALVLRDALPFPESLTLIDGEVISGTTLGNVLRCIHRPASAEERNWGWPHREWAYHCLGRLASTKPEMPNPGLIKTPADAELHACEVLRSLGFLDAETTAPGPDGGVDVRGADIVAQVKLEGVKTDAPRLQSLSGIASHENRQAAYFSLGGYTKPAVDWAERVDMALFEFDYSGEVVARSTAASLLMSHRAERRTVEVEPALRQQVEEALKDADNNYPDIDS